MAALTHHGGRVDQAARNYPQAPLPWIDLSTGINPDPWTPARPIACDLGPLPTPSALAELEATAAAYFGASAACVTAVPGSEIALRMLDRIGLPAPYRHVAPGYRSHAESFAESQTIAFDGLSMGAGTTLFANPANPQGRVLGIQDIRGRSGDGWLVVDEAFADCDPMISIIPALPERTIVLRSFGKFFGLAGVRLGFVVGPPAIVASFRALLGDWPVSSLAIAYGTAAYADTGWIAATRAALPRRAAALDAVLIRHGLTPSGDCPLFRLVASDRPLFDRLARAGMLTRPFDYAPHWTRFGVPHDDNILARLDRALADG